jgi:hypothetical protein
MQTIVSVCMRIYYTIAAIFEDDAP